MKFTIRDLIYVTAIIALFSVWQTDRQRSQLTPEEQAVVKGLRKYKSRVKAQQLGRPNRINSNWDWNPSLIERIRSSV